jgi:GT2 family glycosyltransferase
MLPSIEQKDVFVLNDQYRFVESSESDYNDRIFLQHTGTSVIIETDDLGKRILESLPASFQKLTENFKTGNQYVSPKLIRFYLLVSMKAGIIAIEGKTDLTEQDQPRDIHGKANISVVIVTFNGEKFIGPNLESLYKQTLAPQEIIVVDNASTDQTLDIVKQDYKNVNIIKNKKNYHYARAVNIGVEAAVGDLVLILNQDLVLAEDFIEMLYHRYLEEADKETAAGIVPQMRFSKLPNFINGIGNFITEKNWGSDNYFCVVDIGQFDHLKYVGSACFGAILVTKTGWQKIGPLDKAYKSFYEDVDWSIRAHLAGMKLLAAPKAIVYHAFGGSYPSGLKLYMVAKNRIRFVLKNLKGKLMKKFFKKYLKQDIRNSIIFFRQNSYKNVFYYMKAYFRLFWEIPGILGHRRKNKADAEPIGRFFTKGAPFVSLSNEQLNPVINKHVIRSYYYFTEMENFQYPIEPIFY